MKITQGRRLAAILGAYIGIFSLYVLLPDMRAEAWRIAVLIAVLFAGSLFFGKKTIFPVRKMVLSIWMAVFVVFACVRGVVFVVRTEVQANRYCDGEAHCARGYVTEISYEQVFGSSYEIRLMSVDGNESDLGAVLMLPYNGDFSVGDVIAFEAEFAESDQQYDIYRKADGIFLTAEAEAAEQTGEQLAIKSSFFENLRLAIQRNFQSYMNTQEAGFATAIMTGNRENLDGHVRLSFARIGVSHILAVSGLHLSVIIGGLDLFFRGIAVPRKAKNLFLIFCTCFFACLCGLSASIVRAAVMLTLAYIADIIGERYDSPTALFVAIFLIMTFRPLAVYDVGMWMSFLATLGILTTAPVISRIGFPFLPRLPAVILRFLISVICITVAASFFTLPVTYIAFGGISLISPLANLIVIPLTQIILYLLIVLTMLGGIPVLAEPLGRLAQTWISGVCALADGLSDFKGIYVSLKYPFVPWVIFTLLVGVLAVLTIRRIRVIHLFTVFAACMVLYGGCYFGYAQMQRNRGYVYLQTDGKSDVVGIVSGNETVLVDISTGGYSVLGEAVKRMDDFYACEIDALVLTHYHSYHVNTLLRLTEQIKIHRLLLPQPHSDNDLAHYEQIRAMLSAFSDIEVYATDTAQTVKAGNAVLSLEKTEYLKRSSHPIVRFSVSFGEKGVSYLGESATETDISDLTDSVVILGADGPPVRHIFSPQSIGDAELVILTDRSYAELTDMEMISGKTVFSEDYGGCIKILFE